ncbi:MAG: sulfatase, partial [Candidatus Binatia bacterium]
MLVAAAALLGAGALAWRAGWIGGPGAPRNVLVIAIDSQRTDRLGAYGSGRALTPFLDELAARSVVYEQAYAPSSWTLPTVASLFVGKYPSEHGVTRFFTAVADVETTLAEVMATHGFTTWALTTNSAIDPDVGFGQGFERYELVGEPTMMSPKADGGLINDKLFGWIDADPASKETRHFVYLHYMDVHAPYRPHFVLTESRADDVERGDIDLNLRVLTGSRVEGHAKQLETWNFSDAEVRRIAQMYDGEVRYQDGILKALFDGLAQRGFLDNTLVIITADHGEELGLHRTFYHGTSLFDPAIHVPLIIQDPQAAPG